MQVLPHLHRMSITYKSSAPSLNIHLLAVSLQISALSARGSLGGYPVSQPAQASLRGPQALTSRSFSNHRNYCHHQSHQSHHGYVIISHTVHCIFMPSAPIGLIENSEAGNSTKVAIISKLNDDQ